VVVRRRAAVALAVASVVAGLAFPSAAAAQTSGETPPARIPPRLEIGGGGGLMVAYPEISGLASVPIGPLASFEVTVGWMPRIVYQVEHGLIQAQVRLPFRRHLRSRRSLLLGVTRVSTRQRNRYDSGFWGDDLRVVFPHAGASLQWPMGHHVDFRLDAQGLFTLDGELPLVPRAAATFVWHPGRGR
jgi:hypothetical protein